MTPSSGPALRTGSAYRNRNLEVACISLVQATTPGKSTSLVRCGYHAVGRGSPRSGGGSATRGALVEQKLNIM
ncbi:hypothetical protein I7X09_16055 [Rhodococcus sp. P-2]|uniref:hypothetical protein n=1 Tax=Rhodococcus sp. P-2 TaxID=2795031 RepID=UPI0019038091|nr:hypothetical protein [Rhodococcus sp. P-2]QQM25145.1 hypothetical protein I7X09_16055 [Rhodococcus sp. P-2]